jgi:hypothetical protein
VAEAVAVAAVAAAVAALMAAMTTGPALAAMAGSNSNDLALVLALCDRQQCKQQHVAAA